MSDENIKKEEKKPTTDTTGQPVTTPTTPTTAPEGERKDVTITVKHEFKTEKPTDVPPVTPPVETQKPAEKPAETSTETPKEKELREKLEEREAQLTTIALKEFEVQRTAFLDLIKDPEKRASAEKMIGDDPDKLESAKMMAQLMISGIEQAGGQIKGKPEIEKPTETPKTPEKKPEDDGTEKVPPVGVVKAPPAVPTGGDAKQIAKETIDTLFATLADPSKSQAEKDKANQMINDMYGEYRRAAKEKGIRDKYDIPPTMECPKCHNTMMGNFCQSCGYEIPKMQR